MLILHPGKYGVKRSNSPRTEKKGKTRVMDGALESNEIANSHALE
jgi:hypothetical protein